MVPRDNFNRKRFFIENLGHLRHKFMVCLIFSYVQLPALRQKLWKACLMESDAGNLIRTRTQRSLRSSQQTNDAFVAIQLLGIQKSVDEPLFSIKLPFEKNFFNFFCFPVQISGYFCPCYMEGHFFECLRTLKTE